MRKNGDKIRINWLTNTLKELFYKNFIEKDFCFVVFFSFYVNYYSIFLYNHIYQKKKTQSTCCKIIAIIISVKVLISFILFYFSNFKMYIQVKIAINQIKRLLFSFIFYFQDENK